MAYNTKLRFSAIIALCIITLLIIRLLYFTTRNNNFSLRGPLSLIQIKETVDYIRSFDYETSDGLQGILTKHFSPFAFSYFQHDHLNASSGSNHTLPGRVALLSENYSYAYVTFMASMSYLPALEVFLYSFVESKPSYPLLVGIPLTDNYLQIVASVISTLTKYNQVLTYELYLWPIVSSPFHGGEKDRWKINWTKLQLWTMTHYKKLFYLDLDIIIFRNLDEVFDYYPFKDYLGTYDWGKWSPIGTAKMNGGVFLVQPSMSTFYKLCAYRMNVLLYRSIEAEQGLFNTVFLRDHCCLPVFFNMQKTIQTHIPILWHPDAVIILHYTGEKPWGSWSTKEFRESRVSVEEKKLLQQDDHWDADDYEELHLLWKQYYFRARQPEFTRLVMYEVDKDHQLQRSKTGALRQFFSQSLAINHTLVKTVLPKSICWSAEIAGLFTVYSQSPPMKKSFIGYCSSAPIVNDTSDRSCESIDWTKVSLQPQTFYYWHAIPFKPNNNGTVKGFYGALEAEYPGILKVWSVVVKTALPKIKTRDYYILSHSFITSKELFSDYCRDVLEVIKRYLKKYRKSSSSSCPFQVSSRQIQRRGWLSSDVTDRCIHIFLEVYFNLWIEQKQLTTRYVVDNPSWRGF